MHAPAATARAMPAKEHFKITPQFLREWMKR
jgi:hypothetical protein